MIAGETLLLLPQKAVKWKDILLIADLHLGKIGHFRRSGVAIPGNAVDHNTDRLIWLLDENSPSKVVFLGDLFHSHYNSEWESFRQIIENYPQIEFHLVQGNHDIMSKYRYLQPGIVLHEGTLYLEPFILSHEPVRDDSIPEGSYNLAGHIHPGVKLKGRGRQQLNLPCFYFNKKLGLLPAFGVFTGIHCLNTGSDDQVYVIADNLIYKK